MSFIAETLVAEIGSTTTVVNAFHGLAAGRPVFMGQGQAATTVLDGDVRDGLNAAIADLARNLGADNVEYGEMFATSSAAGGLRTTVHGLVYDMTARAAKEAALGAGSVLRMITAGRLTESDLAEIAAIAPNLILLAGGTDYGERETALENMRLLATLPVKPPLIYAGNIQNRTEIKRIADQNGMVCTLVDNVYPRLDELCIEPTRQAIHRVFEAHITEAPGMAHIRDLVTGTILPTPGAVMESALLLYDMVGDVAVLDVGGATTDVHSVTEGSEEIALIQIAPEPKAKRTVEGDLGLYLNARHLAETVGFDRLAREVDDDLEALFAQLKPIPDARQLPLTHALAYYAAEIALTRHAGKLRYTYGASGRKAHADGKDLTAVRALVATGGALTRLDGRNRILDRLCALNGDGQLLLPKPGQMRWYQDRDYIMASVGVLCRTYPDACKELLKKSLNL